MGLISKLLAKLTARVYPFWATRDFTYTGELGDNATIGAIADRIAVNVGKLTPQVVRRDGQTTVILNNGLSKLLNLRPCPEASTYDWLYRIGSDLAYRSNHFSVVFYNDDFTQVERIQPITVRGAFTIFENDDGVPFFRFRWDYDGLEYTIPYQFVIHIKSRYNRKRFSGTPPDTQLASVVELLETTNEGVKNIVKKSATLRGYLKHNNFMDDDELKEKVKTFQDAYMRAENDGGLAGLDTSFEFVELKGQPAPVPVLQISLFKKSILEYYGMNENILSSQYKEDEFNAFYESVIEPIAIQLSLEFTYKLLTVRQRDLGEKIVFAADRLQFASLNTRANLGKDFFDRGAITINELRGLVYLPAIEGGDVRQVSLNYVRADDQQEYQVGEAPAARTAGAHNAAAPPVHTDARLVPVYVAAKLKGGECDADY